MTQPIKKRSEASPGLAYPVELTNGRTAMLWTGLVILLITAIVLAIPVYQIVSTNLHKNQFDRAKFNKQIWALDKSGFSGGSRRTSMAEDVLKRVLKPGMSRSEVVSILGELEYADDNTSPKIPADSPSGDNSAPLAKGTHTGYYLGEQIGGEFQGRKEVDRAWLDLKFDSSDRYSGGSVYLPPAK